jgi:hypothetical protein
MYSSTRARSPVVPGRLRCGPRIRPCCGCGSGIQGSVTGSANPHPGIDLLGRRVIRQRADLPQVRSQPGIGFKVRPTRLAAKAPWVVA